MYCVIYNCIHVLTSFLHGYSATLAAKLFIKLELSELSWILCSFCLLIPLSHPNLHSLLLPRNNRDRIETVTECIMQNDLSSWSITFSLILLTLLRVLRHQRFLATANATINVADSQPIRCSLYIAGVRAMMCGLFKLASSVFLEHMTRAAWTFSCSLLHVSNADIILFLYKLYRIYTVSQKRPPFYFSNNSVKIKRFYDFVCVKSWENLTSIACTLAHLTCIL